MNHTHPTPTTRLLLASAIATSAALLIGCNKAPDDVVVTATPPTTTGTDIDDSVVTGRVKTALMAASDIQSLDISVVTVKGEVTLSGVVENQGQIDMATKVARDIEGARSVRNDLTLKP